MVFGVCGKAIGRGGIITCSAINQSSHRYTKTILSYDDALKGGDPLPKQCRHDYRLYNNQPGEWKLIWECRKCGVLCICKCFKTAIDKIADAQGSLEFNVNHDVEWLAAEKGVTVEQMNKILDGMEYCGMACELCLDKDSTHSYSDKDPSTTEFERRYGAYILRDAIVLAADNDESVPQSDLLKKAEDKLRDMYGFRPRGETETDNDKLHDIVNGLFPEEVVLRSHTPEWLPNDDLEVFIPGFAIALEHRGVDHYELSNDNDLDDLRKIMDRDERREKTCIENGVDLIAFPYFIELDRDTVGWKIAEIRSRK